MTPERWRRVEEVYQAVLERPTDARASFLADALSLTCTPRAIATSRPRCHSR